VKFLIRLGCCLFLALVGLGSVAAPDPAEYGFQMAVFDPPAPAPEFELNKLAGDAAVLSDFRGSYVLLNFWATWCPPCLEEMPAMEKLYQAYSDKGLMVVAISSDREGAEVVRGFVERLGVSFPILLDPDAEVSLSYGARNLPLTALVSPDGNVLAAAVGARDWGSKEAFAYVGALLANP